MKKQQVHITFLGIIILLVSNVCNAQEIESQFQNVLDSTYQGNKESIGIMIHVESPNNSISWTSAVGFSNKNTKEKLNKNQPLLIASNTKTYVSATILKLIENGGLKLNQPIIKLIPEKTKELLKKSGYNLNEITVKHLLSHTSGISDYVDDAYFSYVNKNPNHKWTRNEQIKLAMKKAHPDKAGKIFAYGDINYLLLTEIIEQKTGKPFYTAIRDLLEFEKHNLNNTWFVDLEEKPTKMLPFAQQYSSKFNESSSNLDPSWDLYGGGGLASNTKDLAIFFQLLFNGGIIKDKAILKSIYTYVLPREESNYCLGLRKISFFGEMAYYHGGFWGTDVMYLPKYNTTVSVFTLKREKRELNAQISNQIIKILENQSQKEQTTKNKITTIQTNDYELIKSSKSKAILIVFPGGGSTSKETKEEFKIVKKATENGISVLLMNFNRHLWIEKKDAEKLSKLITETIEKNQLKAENIFIGGISLGGTVALTLSNHLIKTNSKLKPKGVFVVDSPIDLFALYESSQKDLLRNDFSEERLAEPKWIINYFEKEFGGKDSLLLNIQKVSPFTLKTNNIDNIKNLKNSKLRFYTEPDTLWWKETRQTDFESTNAFTLQKINALLEKENWKNISLIQTKNKGYRANGERNPHSWSIVDSNDLINWILK